MTELHDPAPHRPDPPAPPRRRRRDRLELLGFVAFLVVAFVFAGMVADTLGMRGTRILPVPLLAAEIALSIAVLPVVALLQRARGARLADLGLRAPPAPARRVVTLGVGLGVAVKLATIPLGLLGLALGLRPEPPDLAMDGVLDLPVYVLAGAAAAVVEEVVFRGYLRDRLARAFGWGPAAWPTAAATSLLFGAGHGYQGVLGVAVTVFVGWLLFLIATSPRLGLVYGIVAHATFNATAFLCVGALRS